MRLKAMSLLRTIKHMLEVIDSVEEGFIRYRGTSIAAKVCQDLAGDGVDLNFVFEACPPLLSLKKQICRPGGSTDRQLLIEIYIQVAQFVLDPSVSKTAYVFQRIMRHVMVAVRRGDFKPHHGICDIFRAAASSIDENPQEYSPILTYHFLTWPKYSGHSQYPVCTSEMEGKAAWDMRGNVGGCWVEGTEYGRNRRELLNHIFRQSNEFLNEHYGRMSSPTFNMETEVKTTKTHPEGYKYRAIFTTQGADFAASDSYDPLEGMLIRECVQRLSAGDLNAAYIKCRDGWILFNTSDDSSPAFRFARNVMKQLKAFEIPAHVEWHNAGGNNTLAIRIDPNETKHIRLAKSIIFTLAAEACVFFQTGIPNDIEEIRMNGAPHVWFYAKGLPITKEQA